MNELCRAGALALMIGAGTVALAQEDPPATSPDPPAAAAEQEGETTLSEDEQRARQAALRKELQALEARAGKGDHEAALELGNKLVSYRNAGAAVPFYRQAARADLVEAQEKLGLLLLNSGDRSLWPEGHSWLDRAVQGGAVRATEEQARILIQGSHGREQAVQEGVALLERARALPGAKEAHFLLGKMAAEGVGMKRDGALAVEHLRRGVEAGSLDAMLGLVELYRTGSLVEKNLAEAERLAVMAYELGSAEAAYQLAVLHEQADPERPDLKASREWLEKARAGGHAGASARLGTYALQGMGEEQDALRGYHLYREAAMRGHSEAAFAVGKLYDDGQGVPADPVAAAGWYRIAAESGHAQAQNEYGARLASGSGVPPDLKAAVQWFERASRQQFPAAFVNLGELYLAGNGVEQNPAQAYSLIEAAAKAGHIGGQERLARLCEQGIGIGGVPDPVGAAYWATRAAAQDERLAEYAGTLRTALNEAQRGELQRRLAAVGIGGGTAP